MPKKDKNKPYVLNAIDLVVFVWEKKWILIIVSVLAALASIFISLKMEDKFKSSVTFFPAADVSISKNLVETSVMSMDSRDILSFGEEEEAERLLQILNSEQIRGYIIEKHNLMEHYEIDPGSTRFPKTKLYNKYNSAIKFRRTQFMSIIIEVYDKDARKAADIANDIASYVDSIVHKIQKERAYEAFLIVEKEYNACQEEIEKLNKSLQRIRNLGIIDYESQAKALNDAYADALAKGNTGAATTIENKMNVLTKYGGTYITLSKEIENELDRLGQLKDKYAAAKVNLEQTIPQIFIIDKAYKSERKALPKRSVIVIVSTFSTFAFALLLLLIRDIINKSSKKKKKKQ